MIDRNEVYEFIRARRHGVVASIDANGTPEAALVGLAVTKDLELIFDTTDATRKCPNLRRDPRIAVVIGWDGEQTLQIEGIADEPKDGELARLKEIYFAAFPDGPDRQGWPGITYFRVRPRWLRFSDYNRPARVEELKLP